MNIMKHYYTPVVSIKEIELEGFICESIQNVMFQVEVDEYATFDSEDVEF